jgi:hypothetical protein
MLQCCCIVPATLLQYCCNAAVTPLQYWQSLLLQFCCSTAANVAAMIVIYVRHTPYICIYIYIYINIIHTLYVYLIYMSPERKCILASWRYPKPWSSKTTLRGSQTYFWLDLDSLRSPITNDYPKPCVGGRRHASPHSSTNAPHRAADVDTRAPIAAQTIHTERRT